MFQKGHTLNSVRTYVSPFIEMEPDWNGLIKSYEEYPALEAGLPEADSQISLSEDNH